MTVQPATPVESAVAFDLIRATLADVLIRRVVRGSAKPIRITKRRRDEAAKLLPPGKRAMVRVALDADETILAWLELVDDEGQRPGVVYSNLAGAEADPAR